MPIIDEIQTRFAGGIQQNSKTGLLNAASFTRNLNIYEDDDSVTLNPIPIKDSASTVVGLVKWIVDANPYENARYALDDGGNIYRIASDVWTLEHTISGGTPGGQGLIMLFDGLYFANSTTIGRKFPLSSGSGTYNDDFFSDGILDLDASVTASGQTYQPPTSISETATNKITYTPAYDPLKAVQVYVTAKGTGNWTATLHDNNNNSIGTATIANASLTNGAMNSFAFATPPRIIIGAPYHIHFTSTVADGTLQTGTISDLSTAQYKTTFGILVGDVDYHPMIQHTNGVTGTFEVGNEHYIGTWDGITYNPNKIALEPGFKVRAQTRVNENTIHVCWKGSNIDSFEYGREYVWDGIQPYFNYSRELTQGMPNAIMNFKNRLLGIFGSSGDIEVAPDESAPFRQIQPAPKLTIGARVEVLPGAIAVWQRRALFGYSNTNDAFAGSYTTQVNPPPAGIEQGVYEFGNQSDRAISYTSVSTEVLNFAYQPSTAIVSPTAFKIGCVEPFGKDCYISYKDGSTYYVDRITKGNNPCAYGSWESLLEDKALDKLNQLQQQPQKEKSGWRVVVSCATLPVGCTLIAKYKINRAANWTYGTAAAVGENIALTNFAGTGGQRYFEVEYGWDVTATVNYPFITSVGLFFETLQEETDA